MQKEINIYTHFESWISETPDAVIRGEIIGKTVGYIEIFDENGYTQILSLDKLYAIVY